MKITLVDDENLDFISKSIHAYGYSTPRAVLEKSVLAIIPTEEKVLLVKKEEATRYFVKKHGAIIVEMPKLAKDKGFVAVQIAIAVGRRLERYERAMKANAGRDADSRRKIAQNAVQSRWES